MQAIELVTALEALLTPETGLRSAIKKRGIPLIASTPEEEDYYMKVLVKVQDIRNTAVHKGRLPHDVSLQCMEKRPSYLDLLKTGIRLCGQMIAQIIVRGSFPSWEPTEQAPSRLDKALLELQSELGKVAPDSERRTMFTTVERGRTTKDRQVDLSLRAEQRQQSSSDPSSAERIPQRSPGTFQ